jgi:predicted DNA-binding protein
MKKQGAKWCILV